MPKELSFDSILPLAIPLLKAALIFIVGHFIIKYLLKGLHRAFVKSKLNPLLRNTLNRVIDILLHCIVLLSALTAVGISTTGLVAATSAVVAGVALSLKDSLSNIASGIILLFSPRFAAGDSVVIDGEEGTIIRIDLMHTTLLTLDRRRVSIPNSVLANSQITDLSAEPCRRVDIKVPISYDADIELARTVLFRTAASQPLAVEDDDHKPFVNVNAYESSAVLLLCGTWCRPQDYWPLRNALMKQYLIDLKAAGIHIPYTHVDVHLSSETEV